MNFNKYQEENDRLLNWIVQKNFFDIWSKRRSDKDYSNTKDLELYITADCNLKCEYCYLKNFGDYLYPRDLRNKEAIKNNIKVLFNYIRENNFFIGKIELFSGEIWHTQFGLDILQIILNYNREYKFINLITIPTNGTFINYDYYTQRIEYFIEEFDKIGIRLHISFSIDGYVIEEKSRPLVDGKRNNLEEFYDKLFSFAKSHRINCGFHPMVSAYCSDVLVDNYKWWFKSLKKHELGSFGTFMALEVRNDNWTEESIKNYTEYLKWKFEYAVQEFNGDKSKIIEYVFRLSDFYKNNTMSIFAVGDRMPCSIQHNMCVRVGDLAICPCHRLSYKNKIFGNLIVEDGKITGIKSNNVELAIKIWTFNPKTAMVKCDSCGFKKLCLKGCLGSQYESTSEMFNPIDSICELFKTKIYILVKLCEQYGLLDEVIQFDEDYKQKTYLHTIELLKDLFKSNDWKEYVKNHE